MKRLHREYITIRSYNPLWCSHLPILSKILQISNGPVMELGIGIFSTPFFHTFCDAEKRFLDSYENSQQWIEAHKRFVSPLHHITLVTDWDAIPIEKRRWGIVFVDHVATRRSVDAIRAAGYADFVILHDSNGRYNKDYNWPVVYPHFKHQYVYNRIHPHTTVLSNLYSLEVLWKT